MSNPSTVVQASLTSESSLLAFRNNLLWHLQDAVVTLDAHGYISLWNPAAERLLGHSSEEAMGLYFEEILKPAKQSKSEFSHWIARPEASLPITQELQHKNGKSLFLILQSFDYQDQEHNVTTLLLQEAPAIASQEQQTQDVLATLRSNRNLDEALQFTVRKLGELISADICRLWLYEPEKKEFLPLRHEFVAANLQASYPRLSPLKPPSLINGHRQSKTLYIPDTQRWGNALEESQPNAAQNNEQQRPLSLSCRSLLRLPLICEGEHYGLIQAECLEQSNPWAEETILQAQRITDAATSIIHQARREELAQAVIQQRARQQEMLAILSQRALMDPYLPVFIELTAVMVSKTLGVERCRVMERPSQPNGKLLPNAAIGHEHQWPSPSTERPMDSLAAYTLACNQPVIAEDMGSETRFASEPSLNHALSKSAAAVLICNAQGVYGVLEVSSSRRRAFRTHDISFLQAVANVVGQVAQRAQSKMLAYQDNEPYGAVLEAVGHGFLTLKLENGDFRSNERFCTLLGRGAEFTQSPLDLVLAWIHPEDRKHATQLFAPVIHKEQSLHLPLRLQHAWGHFVTLQFQALIFCDETNKPIRVAALCQEMSSLNALVENNNEANREDIKKLNAIQQLLESSSLGMMLWHQDGKILHSNDAFLAMLGYDRGALLNDGLNWRKLTPPESASQDGQALHQIFTTGFTMPYEKQYITRDGQMVEVLQGAARLAKNPEEGIAFILNITPKNQEIKRLQRALHREQLQSRVIEILKRPLAPDLLLNTVAAEIGNFFQSDRCTIARWSNAQMPNEPIRITKLAQYRASDHLEWITLENIPSIEARQVFQSTKDTRWMHFPNLNTFNQALQGFCDNHPSMANLAAMVANYWKTYHIQSYFSLNIYYENTCYGCLSLHQCTYSKSWSQEDLEFLEQITQHIGRVMHQDSLKRQDRTLDQELENQHALMKNIFEVHSHGQIEEEAPRLFQELLESILSKTKQGFGFVAKIIPTTTHEPKIILRATHSTSANSHEALNQPAPTMEDLQRLAEQLLNTKQAIVTSLEIEPDQPAWENFLALPLMSGQQVIGMLGLVNQDRADCLSEELNGYVTIAAVLLDYEHLHNQRNKDLEYLQGSMNLAQYQATQLERSNRELEQFAITASHDLQAPLRKIMQFCDFLKSSLGEKMPLESADFMSRIQKSTHKMQTLISTLLVLSKINSQGKPFQPVNLGHVIQEVLIDLEQNRKDVNAVVYVGETMTIEADHIQMHQILQNLIGNALKFNKRGQEVLIEISAQAVDEHTCEIIVKDNGIGFDEKNLNLIFKAYERLRTRSAYEGTGLGLAIVQKIVERHCGIITAQSAPDQGATFRVRLPIRQTALSKAYLQN